MIERICRLLYCSLGFLRVWFWKEKLCYKKLRIRSVTKRILSIWILLISKLISMDFHHLYTSAHLPWSSPASQMLATESLQMSSAEDSEESIDHSSSHSNLETSHRFKKPMGKNVESFQCFPLYTLNLQL